MLPDTAPVALIDFAAIFQHLPGMYLLLSPGLKVVAATDAYLGAVQHTRATAIGLPVAALFAHSVPDNKILIRSLMESLEKAAALQVPHTTADQPYHQPSSAGIPHSERYWRFTNIPLHDHKGQLQYILHRATDETPHYQALQEGKAYRKSFELLTQTSSDAVWEWDIATNRITHNEAFEELFGYPPDTSGAAAGLWKNRLHPDDRTQVSDSLDEAIRKGSKAWAQTYRYCRADGSYAAVHDRAIILYHEQQAVRMVGTMVDLSRQEQATRELKEASQRITLLLESIPQLAWTTDENGQVTYLNSRWQQYTGATESELLTGQKLTAYLHPDDRSKMQAAWDKAKKQGAGFELEYRWLRHTDHAYRWHLARVLPVRNEEGEIVQWVGTATDIEEQKKIQKDLERSGRHFRFLADTMPQLVWTTDPQGSHDYFNQRWEEYTGYDLEASKGPDMWNNLLHPDDRARARARWNYSLETGEPYQIEYRFRNCQTGQYRWFLGRALPMRDATGRIVKWFGTCTDIEDHKQAEEALTIKNQELEQINDDLDSFVYTASHDLKLPIINIGTLFEEMLDTVDFRDEEGRNMAELIRKSIVQVRDTIDGLAEIVKVQKDINAQQEEVCLHELLEEVKLSIHDMVAASEASIVADFSQAPCIRFSHVNLKSILYNLVSNAVKFRSPGRPARVWVRTWHEDDTLVLQVADNGIGIDMEKYGDKLFQMFRRFHNHVPGSGLGLYILSRIMQKNGGRTEVSSQLGHGTSFTLYFTTTGNQIHGSGK